MNKSDAQAIAKGLFESYPSVNEFHVTGDGNAFEQKHHAESHVSSLPKDNRDIISVTRQELEEPVTVEDEAVTEQAQDDPASGEPATPDAKSKQPKEKKK